VDKISRGFDRFTRIKDQQWYDYGAASDADRTKHGYNRAGNRLYREQTTDPNRFFDEFYNYCGTAATKEKMENGVSLSEDDCAKPINRGETPWLLLQPITSLSASTKGRSPEYCRVLTA
jgi:hypothetical protein